jgi:site-specific DNA-methyltransferase (adenine-specific)
LNPDVEYRPTSLAGRVDGSLGSSRSLGSIPEEVPVFDCAEGCAVAALDKQSGTKQGKGAARDRSSAVMDYGDSGGASRFFPQFFYNAKASRSEREAGLDGFAKRQAQKWTGGIEETRKDTAKPLANVHPTVKPTAVMQWLIRLVTPPGGLVLDPFNGSGSTGVAAMKEGMRYVGIEREAEYVKIAEARISHAASETDAKPFPKLKTPEPPKPTEPLPTPEDGERSTRSLDPDYFKKLVAKSLKKSRK